MTIKELRAASGMTQKAFSEYFGVSKRTIESWESGARNCPDFIRALIEYKLLNEGLICRTAILADCILGDLTDEQKKQDD